MRKIKHLERRTKMIIRRLIENDLESLAKLYKYFWNVESDLEKMKVKLKELNDNPKYIVLAALIEETMVGSVMGIICEDLYGECKPYMVMENLIVNENFRSKGIGRALLIELENVAKDSDCTQMLFITEANRKNAISFYGSLGYNTTTHVGFKKSLK